MRKISTRLLTWPVIRLLTWPVIRSIKKLNPEFYLCTDKLHLFEFYARHKLNYLTITIENTMHPLPVVIEFDNTLPLHGFLPNDIRTFFSDTTFTLDRELEAKSGHFFQNYQRMLHVYGKRYFDGDLVRLKCVSSSKKGVHLCIQPVKYNAVCKTHMCLDAPAERANDTIRHLVHGNGLEDLANSRLPNSLGVNTLLFTVDGELIIQKRSREVVVFPSLLGVGSSGSFDADDFMYAGKSPQKFPFIRESREELNIHHDDIIYEKFLGITRELFRGGKPEMFFIAKTRLGQAQIIDRRNHAKDKWESSRLIFIQFGEHIFNTSLTDNQKHRFRCDMNELFKKHHINSMSWPLSSALALWQKDLL